MAAAAGLPRTHSGKDGGATVDTTLYHEKVAEIVTAAKSRDWKAMDLVLRTFFVPGVFHGVATQTKVFEAQLEYILEDTTDEHRFTKGAQFSRVVQLHEFNSAFVYFCEIAALVRLGNTLGAHYAYVKLSERHAATLQEVLREYLTVYGMGNPEMFQLFNEVDQVCKRFASLDDGADEDAIDTALEGLEFVGLNKVLEEGPGEKAKVAEGEGSSSGSGGMVYDQSWRV